MKYRQLTSWLLRLTLWACSIFSNLSRATLRAWQLLGQAGLVAVALTLPAVHSQTLQEHQAKVDFLYNFPKFVDWPPGAFAAADTQLVVCVVGTDPFESALDALSGKRVGGRPIAVRRYSAADPLGQCHMLFVSDSEKRRLGQILAAVGSAPVLLVGEMENFTQLGGMIQLVSTDTGIQFKINVEAARRHGLKLSARLLQLASVVSSVK